MRDKKKVKPISIRRRVISCLIILFFAAMVSSLVLAVSTLLSDSRQRSEDVRTMLDNYIAYSDKTNAMMGGSYGISVHNLSKSTALTASALKETAEDWYSGSDSDVKLYKDGCLFLYDGKDVQLPAGIPEDMNTQIILPDDHHGVATDYDPDKNTGGKYAFAYTRIQDDLYYMEWTPWDESDAATGNVDWDALLKSITSTYGMSVIELQEDESGKLNILGGSDSFSSYATAEDLGLTKKMIMSSMNGENQLLRLGYETYFAQAKIRSYGRDEDILEEDTGNPETIVMALVPSASVYENFRSSFLTFVLVMLIFGIALIVWIVLVYRVAAGGPSDVAESEKIKPSEMRKKVIVYIIASTLTVGCCCAFFHAMNNLFKESNDASLALKNISDSIDDVREGSNSVWEESKKEYIDGAQEVAAILDENPQLRTPEWLDDASDIIGAEYIMLFDTNGDEILTDSRYRGLSLGKDEASATYDFRRLLKGVRNISHEKLTDEVTGETLDMYGVPLKYAGREKDAYGALIIAVDPKERDAAEISENLSDINGLLSAHSVGDYLSFSVDPKTGKIKYSSDVSIIDKDAVAAGLNESILNGSYMGFFDLDSTRRFGRSSEKDNLLYYYSVKRDRMFVGTGSFAQTCMILNLIILSLLAFVLLHGYDDAVYNSMMSGGAAKAAEADEQTGKHNKHAARRGKVYKALGITGGPFRKAMITLMILGAIVLTTMLLVALQGGGSSGNDSVVRYIMSGDWDRGINIFSLTASFLVLCNAVVIIMILYAVRVVLGSVLNSRGSTICSLITSVLQYLTAIIALFIALGYCGVDYKALLASVGIMSMAVSFGARDFVSDIFAGVNLLTNNAYQMGDIVEINGYRGAVREVNLRTTKLAGSGGNVKTIRNSTIGDVINLSARNSVYTSEIVVSMDNDLVKIEELLKNELPEIAGKYPQFLKGPEYKGVGSMGGGKETLLVQTECSQKDYSFVVSAVNKELQLLFKNNGITIL